MPNVIFGKEYEYPEYQEGSNWESTKKQLFKKCKSVAKSTKKIGGKYVVPIASGTGFILGGALAGVTDPTTSFDFATGVAAAVSLGVTAAVIKSDCKNYKKEKAMKNHKKNYITTNDESLEEDKPLFTNDLNYEKAKAIRNNQQLVEAQKLENENLRLKLEFLKEKEIKKRLEAEINQLENNSNNSHHSQNYFFDVELINSTSNSTYEC